MLTAECTTTIDGSSLSTGQVVAVARHHAQVAIAPAAVGNVQRCAALIDDLVATGQPIYGLTTGIGELVRVRIPPEMANELQRRIIVSHAAGTGDPLPRDVVRAAMLLRANLLARGHSGVRLGIVQTLVDMLNSDLVPVVYEKGSLRASGDLSPLAHIAEVMLGSGEAYYRGERMPAREALAKAGIGPIVPINREGLALINGPQVMLAGALLVLHDALSILKHAIVASAMAMDALRSARQALDPRLHELRPFSGQLAVAAALRRLLADSQIAEKSNLVQDGYSLRCIPQVIGPSLDALLYALSQCEVEINAVTDNPIFLPADCAHLAGGNFHGQPVAMAMDFAAIALAEIANLAERHVNRMLSARLSGLPGFLAQAGGLNSGFMLAQYTAAALVSENKVLAHPAVVDSISVSAEQEDHVSMGPVAVRKCTEILNNVATVIAIELLCAAQALDFCRPELPGHGVAAAQRAIREVVPPTEIDRPLHADIRAMTSLVRGNAILDAVEAEVGAIELR